MAIARDIEALGSRSRKLATFDPSRAIDAESCILVHAYRTHRPAQRGGWTAAFDAPDPDGLHFFLHLYHEGDPLMQADLQPAVPRYELGGWRVTILALKGDAGTPAIPLIMRSLRARDLRQRATWDP